jgi:hypothetical protein
MSGSPNDAKRSAGTARDGRVAIFAIFDVEHDLDLYELLREESGAPGCNFDVVGGSQSSKNPDGGRTSVRHRIHRADQVIVICGEHTEDSVLVHSELLIAREDGKAYFLLWGRRGIMCTKPMGAKTAEGMYSWTPQFLHDQISANLRTAGTVKAAQVLRDVGRGGRTHPGAVTTAS